MADAVRLAQRQGMPRSPARPHAQRATPASRVQLGYWKGASWVAVVMIVVIAVRLHEFLPRLNVVQPVLLTTFGGIALLVARSASPIRLRVFQHQLARLAVAYLCFAVVTIPFALWPGSAFGAIKSFFPAVVLLIGILFCAPTPAVLLTLQTALVGATAVYALYAKINGRTFADGRLTAGMGMYDSNDMAAMLALAFPLAVGLFRWTRGWRRVGMAASSVLLITVVVVSGSRGGVLALCAGAVVFALGMKGFKRVGVPVLLLFASLLVWNAAPSSFRERMKTLTNLEEDYNTQVESGREAVWKRGRQYYRENFLIGIGIGNFPVAEGDFYAAKYEGRRGGKWSNAHNAYIQAFAELGTIGGSLFVALLWYGVRRSFPLWLGNRAQRSPGFHRPELLASLCAFMVGAVFLSHAYFFPLFALLGIIALSDAAATAQQNPAAASALRVSSSPRQRRIPDLQRTTRGNVVPPSMVYPPAEPR